ncbi:LysR substrate-binding domain-containing protein [Aeromonas veronii]|uniref:LysR family transcriptional regulator n=1 Tax=Aeromonas veronii TaxID=654 RepID=A0ABY3MIQ9_AERVE|nr:LysR substrate-binding domain-containing protein [Aeromonas veronii]RDU78855.1 LysR family transcriptional regulator [Aeromonas veronii]RDU81926.1 LysR family transcriptional regulator [Aeromonas veronii]RDU82629.1 LysR family transcriptional regulator [Aeromonas veronii]RDU90768.1 LysR family transcriptional regulator [Aeromonas veronii]TEY47935.1 LysR family transcriptional regulator [Aeromonas veronii]
MFGWEGICEFVSVAEQGGFTPAARKLGVSVAQVSRQVAQLEDRLQAKLLLRTTRQVRLTELGEIYYRHCRQLLDNLYEAELAVGRHQAVPQGTLRITAPVSYGESRIAPLVNDFMVRFPQLEVTLNLTNQLLDLVHEGYDLALRLGHLKDSTLVARKLAQRVPYVCASPAYTASHGMPNSLSELTRHTCLVGNSDEWHFTLDGRPHSVRVRGLLQCNSGHALLDAALKGIGIIQLPDYYVSDHLARGELIELLPELRAPAEGIWALYPHNRHLSPKVRLLVDYLAERLSDPQQPALVMPIG